MIRIKRNPSDHELLKEIQIKQIDPEEYLIYHNNKIIGDFSFNKTNKSIDTISIYSEKYRRKGIGTYIYDYIEKTHDIKLKPSPDLLKEGKLFWQNRLKKQNPTDKSLLSKIQIQKELIKIPKDQFRPKNIYYTEYRILLNGKVIGKAEIKKNKNYISWIEIDKNFQRKGLSTYLYNYIENDLEIKLRPSINQLDEGKEFWKSRK